MWLEKQKQYASVVDNDYERRRLPGGGRKVASQELDNRQKCDKKSRFIIFFSGKFQVRRE